MSQEPARSGRCAIVGMPNVGKSTLLNRLLGQKLAIATKKPQTTRSCILGVCVREQPALQLAFVDTPGLQRPRNALGRALLEATKAGLADADAVLLVTQVDPKPGTELLGEHERELLAALGRDQRKVVLAINKVDRVKEKAKLLPLLERAGSAYPFSAIVPISARRGDNVEALVREIGACMPEGLRFDAELLTDKPERFFAAELVREAVMDQTRQEVPYATAVVIEQWNDRGPHLHVAASIIVEKDNQKGIVIGAGGERLKQIGSAARKQIEALIERKVFLELWVKVIAGWTDNPAKVRELLEADARSGSS